MVKSIISIIISILLVFVGVMVENSFVTKSFNELNNSLDGIYQKLESSTANENDIIGLQKMWFDKKEKLHIFIPHTEIKEFDLWISECLEFTKNEDYKESLSKIRVLQTLCHEIPKTFSLRIENLF